MLHVIFPDYCQQEHTWICKVLLGEFLGVDHEIYYGKVETVRIGADGKTLELPDTFFNQVKDKWLSSEIIPVEPLKEWAVADSGLKPDLVSPTIPVIFGRAGFNQHDANSATLCLDVFGSAFFMLSRYEEAFNSERDAHGRFPASASLAFRNGFLGRPIIDEYVEILWQAMSSLWPTLERKERKARMLVSCDVDLPFDPACASLYRLGGRLIRRTLRDKSLGAVPNTLRNHWAVRRGDYDHDPYRQAINWIMDVNDKVGNQVAFNMIPEKTDQKMDNASSLDEPRMRTLMRTIHARGHFIGFHPGYNTYKHPVAFARSVDTLRRVMAEENIEQDMIGGRQHYLRWETLTTSQLWEANGMAYDSTLSYRAVPGFRCGTCHEYPMYDLMNRKALRLRQRPLIIMESSVIDQSYMGLGHTAEALAEMQKFKRICQKFNGDFTLLWHNSNFESEGAKELYSEVIKP